MQAASSSCGKIYVCFRYLFLVYQEGSKWNGTYQVHIYAVNIFGGSINNTKKITEILEVASRETGLEVNAVKTKYMVMSPDNLVGQITTRIRLTYLLTPRCRVLLEKLTGLQLVKKFPAFLWNPKIHYRTHKRPPPVPVLDLPNPVHIPTSHLLEIHPNIIHPSTPRFPQWSLSLRFPQAKYFTNRNNVFSRTRER